MSKDKCNKKILCVIDNLGSGGAQRQMVLLASGLKMKGYEVFVFIYNDLQHFSAYLKENEIKVFLSIKKSRFSFKPIIEIRKLINHLDIDLVISFLDTPNVYSEIACIGKDVKLIVSERSSYVKDKINFFRYFISYMHLLSDVIVTNSESHGRWLKANFPFLEKKIKFIINGIETDKFKPKLENKINTNENEIKIIGVGRISSEKNILPLIKCLSNLLESDIKIKFNWVGRIGCKDYYNECNDLVVKLNLQQNWSWSGERRDIVELLHNHDALILSSSREGFPNVVCEAFACGLPVIASSISDIPKLLGNMERGFLFNPNDINDIKCTVLSFIDMNDDQRKEMSKKVREYALNELSIDIYIKKYEDLFSNI